MEARPVLAIAVGAEFHPADVPTRANWLGDEVVAEQAQEARVQTATHVGPHLAELPVACFIWVSYHGPLGSTPPNELHNTPSYAFPELRVNRSSVVDLHLSQELSQIIHLLVG